MPLDHLTLLVPELLWPEPEDRDALGPLDCPALTTLLARSRLSRRPTQPLEAVLAALFGHAGKSSLGAFRGHGEPGNPLDMGNACWIAADPTHLRFHQDHLILAAGDTLAITQEESNAFVEDLNRHFSDLGAFHVATPDRWYLQLAGKAAPEHPLLRFDAPPLSAVAGRSVARLLPEIMEDREVRKLLNELQTFLHAHPVNLQREERGLATINSLWLWGAGSLPPPVDAEFDEVWSGAPLAIGLARAAGVPTHATPADAADFPAHTVSGTRQLVVLEDLMRSVHYENGEDYRQAVAALETRWFAPLRRALAAGKLKRLRLVAPTAYGTLAWECRPTDPWRFWRRAQPLAEIAKTLAKENP